MLVAINYDIYLIQNKKTPKNLSNFTLNKHLTSKLQFSPNFTLDSVASSNYRRKCDVCGWTLTILLLQTSKTDNNALDIDAVYNLKLRKT
jgi:hypothetical protein